MTQHCHFHFPDPLSKLYPPEKLGILPSTQHTGLSLEGQEGIFTRHKQDAAIWPSSITTETTGTEPDLSSSPCCSHTSLLTLAAQMAFCPRAPALTGPPTGTHFVWGARNGGKSQRKPADSQVRKATRLSAVSAPRGL